MTRREISSQFGGREEHCKHRATGVCGTPGGAAKKACMDEVHSRMTETERLALHGTDECWIYPDAVSAVQATRMRARA